MIALGARVLVLAFSSLAVSQAPPGPSAAIRNAIVGVMASDAFAWSPDGTQLAYARGRTLAIADAQASFSTTCRVTPATAEHVITEIAWAPDGSAIAFISRRAGDRVDDGWDTIWLTTPTCSDARDLLPRGAPFVSPGVRAIALSSWLSPRELAFTQHVGTGFVGLAKIEVDTRRYSVFCTAEGWVHWSPRRDRAAVDLHMGGVGVIDVTATRAVSEWATFCPTRIPGCDGDAAPQPRRKHVFEAWSPDGRSAILTTGACPPGSVGMVDPNDTTLILDVDANRRQPFIEHASHASWSPLGDRIALLTFGTPRRGRLPVNVGIVDVSTRRIAHAMPLGTIDPPFIPALHPDDFRPLWSPDSRRLVVRDISRNVLLMDADGSASPVQLGDVLPAWSADGRYLALLDGASHVLRVVDAARLSAP